MRRPDGEDLEFWALVALYFVMVLPFGALALLGFKLWEKIADLLDREG